MKYFLLIFCTFFFTTIPAQTIYNFSGKYKNGTASYQYYTNYNMDIILDGDFQYTANTIEIKGKFQKNKKTGMWTYLRKNPELKDNNIFIQGEYQNGLKNGTWIFNRYFISNGNKKEFNVTVNFKNDTLVGSIDFPNIKGQFSDHGTYIGKWVYKKMTQENTVEFEDNVVTDFAIKSDTDTNPTAIYKINKTLISSLKNKPSKELGRASTTKYFITNDLIYGTKDIKTDKPVDFKQYFDFFYIGLVQEVDNLLDISHFVEIEKIKVQKPEYLFLKNKLVVQPDEKIYSFESFDIDKEAEFEGGKDNFNKWIRNKIALPEDDKFLGGKIRISYVIEKDGSLSNIQFYNDLGFDLNKQIEKILLNSPKWNPAIIDKQPVRVKNFLYLQLFN